MSYPMHDPAGSPRLRLLVVEDNPRLRPALVRGLEETGHVRVIADCDSGERGLEICLEEAPDVVLMDVSLAGSMNGIDAAVAIRREFPRLPVVFYSIQDDDEYYRAFRRSGILSHYAYVRKSSYLLPEMIVPLLREAVSGRGYVESEIEERVHEVRIKDERSPMDLLEPNEREVARLLAAGMSNEQIASRFGFRDKRTISRVNGQIYTAWGLNESTTDEKVARTRAAIIAREGRLIRWDEKGGAWLVDDRGEATEYPL